MPVGLPIVDARAPPSTPPPRAPPTRRRATCYCVFPGTISPKPRTLELEIGIDCSDRVDNLEVRKLEVSDWEMDADVSVGLLNASVRKDVTTMMELVMGKKVIPFLDGSNELPILHESLVTVINQVI